MREAARRFCCATRHVRAEKLALIVSLAALGFGFSSPALSQASSAQVDPKAVPAIDGGIGPCTADFIVNDASGAPVYAAKVNVHIAYGFANIRKLDLQISTNIDGKARFTGLPDHIKHGIYFHASEGNRIGEAFDDPANTCKTQFTITLREKQ
jgi:hypothetical protein